MQQKKYNIKMSKDALIDLDNILNYIKYELSNPIASTNLKDEIYKKVSKRAENPLAFKIHEFKKEKLHTYYTIQVNNFTVFYILQKHTMVVARILYSRRNFETIIN